MNYFELFNLPQKFELSIEILRNQFYKLQKKFHPDAHQKNLVNQNNNLKQSIFLNQGYQTLRNPLTRVEHLLIVNNVPKQKKIIFSSKFLNKQFLLYKILDNQKKLKNKIELNNFLTQIKNEQSVYMRKLEIFCNTKKWVLANITLHKLIFFNKFIKQIKNIIQTIEN